MTNYLKIKPDQVKYWAKLSAFIFTLVPIVINGFCQQNNLIGLSEGIILLIFLVMTVISYLRNYYLINSIFWPESLSLMNRILLVLCGAMCWQELSQFGKVKSYDQ